MTLTPQWLDELRARTTLSAVIARTLRLTRAGHEFKACCPFHNEKSPSFTVNDAKGFYHCFGCGAHGDAIRWLTDQRGLAFMDAVKELAADAGMEVPAPDPRAKQKAEEQAGLHEVMQAAQDWYRAQLDTPAGARAREYLMSRRFDAHTLERFGFGYAPAGRQALRQGLPQFAEPLLIEAGLRIAAEEKEPYDRFRDRLTIPIHDARGRVIGFAARILDAEKKDAPKYLNSPDTPLFDKGRTLFNLHRAGPAARRSGRIVVVEGQMDTVALAAAGIEEAVAPMGTALTERQLAMLWRLAENPVLCFDGDAAGQRAAMRAVTRALPLLRPAHSLRIVQLPAGMDPDDLIRRDGVAALEALLAEPRSLVDVLWEHERDASPLATPEDKAGLKARLLAHIETIADRDIQALYRRELLERFSAFAFPRREERAWQPGARSKPRPPNSADPARLRRAAAGGAREGLASAILSGLVLWPGEISRHAEMLARAAALDPRFDALLDAADEADPLESARLGAILAGKGVDLPPADRARRIGYPFVRPGVEPEFAARALALAIEKFVEEPAIDAAIVRATERQDHDEQQRLRLRKARLGERLRELVSGLDS